MYAAIKKIRVSLVYALVDHWWSIADYNVRDVAICSIVTGLAINLKLIDGAPLDFIDTHRQIYGYEHFNHAHIINKIKGELYSIQTLHIEFHVRLVNRRGTQGTTCKRAT